MKKTHGQMSEALSTGILLTLSGGFQDAYTYFCRGKVFANAQTGNIVLMGNQLAHGNWGQVFRYLLPLLAFLLGVYMAEKIRLLFRQHKLLHWRQIVVLLEILFLFAVGLMPQAWNLPANVLVSFVCAMQVEAFRKMNGNAYASTMCIGNMRSATEQLFTYRHTKEPEVLKKSLQYYLVILVFAAGAAMGSVMTGLFKEKTIWISCGILVVCFLIMFIREDIEQSGKPEEIIQ